MMQGTFDANEFEQLTIHVPTGCVIIMLYIRNHVQEGCVKKERLSVEGGNE